MSTVAIPRLCDMCGGYGCLVVWRQHATAMSYTTGGTRYGAWTYTSGGGISGVTVRCPACRATELARIKWLRASRKVVSA